MIPKQIARGLLPLLLAAGTLPADGVTRVWTGTQNGLWSNPANWQDGIVPTHLDSIEFPADTAVRETVNDFLGRGFGSITFTGGGYTVSGFKLHMHGGITSVPGNTTNRVAAPIFTEVPLTIACFGYFNRLYLGGIEVAHPIRLVTGSSIYLGNALLLSSGTLSLTPDGLMTIENGTLELLGGAGNGWFGGAVVVGGDPESGLTARLLPRAPNQISDNATILLNDSGILELNGYDQRVGTLSGTGVTLLNSNRLTIASAADGSIYTGELRGTGTFRIEGATNAFELGGQHTFAGRLEVAARYTTNFSGNVTITPSHLRLTGSASNAVVVVSGGSRLGGNGIARGLITDHALVRPGPGSMRFLDSVTLDPRSHLEFQVDGSDASSLHASTIDFGGADLEVRYLGQGNEDHFTLIAANASSGAFAALPEGTWLLAGHPVNEFQLTYSGNGGHDVVLERAGLFVPPTLRIRLSGANRVIEWPVSAPGYTLQFAPSLDSQLWTGDGLPVPDATATDFLVIENAESGERFFRLVR